MTSTSRVRIAYDLDGTLYDTLPLIYNTDQRVRDSLGYAPIDITTYKTHFQSTDWSAFYRNLGIKEEDIPEVIDLWVKEFRKEGLSELIPGARKLLGDSVKFHGLGNIYIVTNESTERVKRRFERDGLTKLIGQTRNPFQGKTQEIYSLANEIPEIPFVYVGDLVSDGEACIEAIKLGAENVQFCGIVHSPSFNTEEAMTEFVNAHGKFTRRVNGLNKLRKIILQ